MDPFFGLFYPIRCMLFHRSTPGLVFNLGYILSILKVGCPEIT